MKCMIARIHKGAAAGAVASRRADAPFPPNPNQDDAPESSVPSTRSICSCRSATQGDSSSW